MHSVFLGIILVCLVITYNSVAGQKSPVIHSWKNYVNTDCGLSISYPPNWKSEELHLNIPPPQVINFIAEIQPNNPEGFNNVVSIEIDDISSLPDTSFQGIRQFDEDYITMGVGTIVSSVSSKVAGFPAQKITYTEPGIGNDEFKKMEVNILAFGKEYKVIYDTTNEKYFNKYFSTFQKILNTFKISDPTFEGIMC
jgi:hypothetical protein